VNMSAPTTLLLLLASLLQASLAAPPARQLNDTEVDQIWTKVDKGWQAVVALEARVEELNSRVEGLDPAIDTKLMRLMEDLKEKIEVKEKRSRQMYMNNNATTKQMNQVLKVVQELKSLPANVSSMMDGVREEMARSLSQAVTREELAQFRLLVARNTAGVRFAEGEWVEFQARGQFDNAPSFFARDMVEYVGGFGDPAAEFWLGLDKLVLMTSGGAQLRVELETFAGERVHATYSDFQVVGAGHRLVVGGYSGTAGDTLRIDNGMAFSTRDADADRWSGNCSSTRGHGGWWFNGCGLANLNGANLGQGGSGYDGILWYFHRDDSSSFRSSRMMVRQK